MSSVVCPFVFAESGTDALSSTTFLFFLVVVFFESTGSGVGVGSLQHA